LSTARPFRFGVEIGRPFDGRTWNDTVREVEALGYSTLFVPDHFDEGLGPIAAMASAAAVTTTLNVGSLVFDCDYRHPAVLAREMATIDAISEGRLELGLGAGWKRWDYDVAGIPMDPPRVRVDRMIEYTKIIKALFNEEPVTFEGEHFRITDLPGTPRPYTPGGPKILIGGGARRVLRFAGQFADIVGVNASIHSGEIDVAAAHDAMPGRIDEKFTWLRDGAGARFESIELNAWLAAAEVTDDTPAVADLLGELFNVDPKEGLDSPLTLVGSIAECVDRLQMRRDRWGYSYTVLPQDKARDFAPLVAELTGT
jgi:probable F420-dependent oxidoreductase